MKATKKTSAKLSKASKPMKKVKTEKRTKLGRDIEAGLREVLAFVEAQKKGRSIRGFKLF